MVLKESGKMSENLGYYFYIVMSLDWSYVEQIFFVKYAMFPHRSVHDDVSERFLKVEV